MPIRNPFKRSGPDVDVQDASLRDTADRGFEKTSVTGAKPITIQEPTEYKLCEINDSGVYLPPSPTEKKGFWQTSSRSSTNSNHRSLLNDHEPFNISRESFDSYRRSFDISARSPMPDRPSLDSRRSGLTSRPSYDRHSFDRRSDRPSLERQAEGFEDVGLNDEPKLLQPKKRSLFARFADSTESTTANTNGEVKPASTHHTFHFSTGRKRAQSGQGSELRSMPTATSPKPPMEVAV